MKWNLAGRLAVGNPFSTLGLDWCSRCRMEVDTDTEANHRRGVYTFRRLCLRCGKAVAYGAVSAPLISEATLPPAAVEWVTRPGETPSHINWRGAVLVSGKNDATV